MWLIIPVLQKPVNCLLPFCWRCISLLVITDCTFFSGKAWKLCHLSHCVLFTHLFTVWSAAHSLKVRPPARASEQSAKVCVCVSQVSLRVSRYEPTFKVPLTWLARTLSHLHFSRWQPNHLSPQHPLSERLRLLLTFKEFFFFQYFIYFFNSGRPYGDFVLIIEAISPVWQPAQDRLSSQEWKSWDQSPQSPPSDESLPKFFITSRPDLWPAD